MAAPMILQNRSRILSFYSGATSARFLYVMRKCLSKVQSSEISEASLVMGGNKETRNIPDKIIRNPTTILEALAKTVRNDINKPVYQTIDDPALLSRSDGLLKNHLAAEDNGRKAAHAMIAMNPEYYIHFWDESLPQSMDIVTVYSHEEPSDEALVERISKRKVTDAIDMYKATKLQGVELCQTTLEQFLELLTVFNHQDPDEDSRISNFISPKFSTDSTFPASTWRKGSLAEDVFQTLPEKSARSYNTLISGMAENFDKERAMEIYREAKAANVILDVFTYNKLLSVVSLDMESVDDIKQEIEFLLKDMSENGLIPNVETFNAVLKNCRRISRWRGTKQYALSVLSEMKACGIESSLGTWVEILNIFYYHKDKAPKTPDLFENILEILTDKSFQMQGPRDVHFFRTAMRVISAHLPNSKLALKLHDILKAHQNFDLIGDRQLQFTYFKELFLTITPVEHTDTVMAIYDSVVPYIFMPPLEVYKCIFENIETFDTYHYIPQLCADIDGSNIYIQKGSVPLFQLMAKKKHKDDLQSHFCNIAAAFLQRWENSQTSQVSPYLDGGVIGDLIQIFLNGNRPEMAQSCLQLYRSHRKLQKSDPSNTSLEALAETLIISNDFNSIKDLLTLMHDLNCENLVQVITRTKEVFQLSDQEINFLDGMISYSMSGISSDSD